MTGRTKNPQNIVFFHPDLGIGGAERLVIDAAVGLQKVGHKITIFTSHCDPKHSFDEACNGTLDVRVRGGNVVPASVYGRFAIVCAILRQLHLIFQITIFSSELRDLSPTVFFVDQLSAGIPLLRVQCPTARVLFYCHFPDKLLAKQGGLLKTLYRWPFDWLESWSTGFSDTIVVNSKFTRSVFAEVFPLLKDRKPGVVYPCVDTSINGSYGDGTKGKPLWGDKKVLLSINRFEKKKDIGLAIRAFAGLSEEERKGVRLVVAGGFDQRVHENFATHAELCQLSESLGLKIATARNVISALSISDDIAVLFLLSVPNSFKSMLLSSARLLIYTPRNEHFGIVPLEAMLAGTPVLAANEGGPTESVMEGETGWLRDVHKVEDWTGVIRVILSGQVNQEMLERMGKNGQERVRSEFSQEKMAERLEDEIQDMIKKEPTKPQVSLGVVVGIASALGALAVAAGWSIVFLQS